MDDTALAVQPEERHVGKRILLVDDDAWLRRSLAFNPEQAGYEVHAAATAEDALAMVTQNRPDLVLLDIGLPDMDGLDAPHSFRQEGLPTGPLAGTDQGSAAASRPIAGYRACGE